MSIDIQIPGYELKRQVGEGGMATVHLAVQKNFGRDVALKIMSSRLQSDPSAASRFQREARIVAQMHHGNIVPVYDVGEHGGHAFLAMEFLSGGDLRGRIDQDIGLEGSLKICIPIAFALDYAHSKGVLHRDVKPANILFREDGTPVLTDFGIARSVDNGTAVLTQTGTVMGTFAYMSPEQARGAPLDGRTDLYSLGIVLYELLIGTRPYRADSTVSLLLKHQNEPIPTLPPRFAFLQSFLDRALAKNPAERFTTGAEMAQALQAFLPATGGLTPTTVRIANGQAADDVGSGRSGRGFSTRAAVLSGGISAAALAAATLAFLPAGWLGSEPTRTLRADATSLERGQAPVIEPPTLTLRADPPAIQSGETTTLRWQATNATSLAIEPGVGTVSLDGSQRVRPSESTTYTARTTGRGGTAVASVAVVVQSREEVPAQTVAPPEVAPPRTRPAPAARAEPMPIVAVAPQAPQEQKLEPPSVMRLLANRTELSATPVSEICEQTSRVDDPIEMRLAKPVALSDGSSIPADTVLTGRIASKRLVGNQPPLVEIEAQRLTIDGRTTELIANPFSFYMSRPSVGGRIAKGAIIGAAAGAVVGVILKKNVAATAAGGAIAGGVIGAASRPPEACVSQTDTTFVFKVTSDIAVR